MAMKRGLALAVAFGALTMGCEDDRWYDNWYTATPSVAPADPSYDSGFLTFDAGRYDEAFYLGCDPSVPLYDPVTCQVVVDEDTGAPADDPADDLHYWYGYVEFQGLTSGASAFVDLGDATGLVEAYHVENSGGGFYTGADSCICEVEAQLAEGGDDYCDGNFCTVTEFVPFPAEECENFVCEEYSTTCVAYSETECVEGTETCVGDLDPDTGECTECGCSEYVCEEYECARYSTEICADGESKCPEGEEEAYDPDTYDACVGGNFFWDYVYAEFAYAAECAAPPSGPFTFYYTVTDLTSPGYQLTHAAEEGVSSHAAVPNE